MDDYEECDDFTFSEIWSGCAVSSIQQIWKQVGDILIYNVLFNLMTQTAVLPSIVFNSISTALGVVILNTSVTGSNLCHFLIFISCAYLLIYMIYRIKLRHCGLSIEYITGIICIIYLLLCEFYYSNQDDWLQARSLFMVAAMKIISFSSDIQHGSELPCIFTFFGYTCCPANSLLGPWFSLKEYTSIRTHPNKKTIYWPIRIVTTITVAFFFLTFSNCWGSYLISDCASKWFLAYRQAQSFRTSHYFISFLSEAVLVAAGYNDDKNRSRGKWSYQITKPLEIEIPSSLVNVVISWNIPMHRFLKKYVYRSLLQFGKFKAILITYLVSSLLHGFNIEIAAVLLTIGIYSYVQFKFQDKLASEFNACLKVRPCKSCNHRYNISNPLVRLAHVLFSLLTIFNLAFLGVLMDSIGQPNTSTVYAKWAKLDFLNHWVMFALHVYTIL